ncbi:MAG: hypothetical protein M3Z14_05540 [Candidatus Eremiobacteraeota bacterium]|nr:hypothetical protein [Candidatus Eremiobacteraeota bacterium]
MLGVPNGTNFLLRRSVTIGGSVALLSTGISTPVLLIGSQVVLGLVLPTVIVPMLFLHLAQQRKKELYSSRPAPY